MSAPRSPFAEGFRLATRKTVIRRGLMYAVIVGSVLIAINHGDAILSNELTSDRVWRMGLTSVVPYVVSTLSSVGAMRAKDDV